MFEAIERATDHVHLEFYTIDNQGEAGKRLAEVLLRKRAAGVAVNLIYDGVGSIDTPKEYFERLRTGGVNAIEFNPVNPLAAAAGWRLNHRDHRKLVIVDGKVAFTGGINISGVYSGSSGYNDPGSSSGEGWRDTNIRVAGPVVADLQREFLENLKKYCKDPLEERNWFPQLEAKGKHTARVIASSPDDSVPAFYVTLVSAIRNATRSVYMTMAYFAPDPQTLEALESRGGTPRRCEADPALVYRLLGSTLCRPVALLQLARSGHRDLRAAGTITACEDDRDRRGLGDRRLEQHGLAQLPAQ
jgi:cardiolipin synthase